MAIFLEVLKFGAFIFVTVLARLLYDPIKVGFGWGKSIQPITDFPYTCRRIHDERFHGCEDLWLSESSRTLYMACGNVTARQYWHPGADHLTPHGRSTTDGIVAVDIDHPAGDSFQYRTLQPRGFDGDAPGDGRLYLNGFSMVEDHAKGTVRFYLVNMRPSVNNETLELLDQHKVGHNATIELFETKPGSKEMKHVKTWLHPQIATPNRVAAFPSKQGEEGEDQDRFFFSNDHGVAKRGWAFHISALVGTGDIGFCNNTACKSVAGGLKYPNGLLLAQDGNLYVPSSIGDGLHVYAVNATTNTLTKIDTIAIPYAMDNLSQDADGDIIITVFPRLVEMVGHMQNPAKLALSGVIRLRKGPSKLQPWVWTKMIEDREKEVLPTASTVVHDVKTGRLFFGGVLSRFITVCEPKIPEEVEAAAGSAAENVPEEVKDATKQAVKKAAEAQRGEL